jgi:hypothetical protein
VSAGRSSCHPVATRRGFGSDRQKGRWSSGCLLVACAMAFHHGPARASDTSTELPVGGLAFMPTLGVRLDTEVLTISPEKVSVQYVLVNQTNTPVTLQIAFPLPEIDLSDEDALLDVPLPTADNFLGFSLIVDGAPAAMDMIQKAQMSGNDVTRQLLDEGFTLMALGPKADAFRARVQTVAEAKRKALIAAGLIVEEGSSAEGEPIYGPGWSVKTIFTRQQILAPGRETRLDLSYSPSVGFSQDTVLRRALRANTQLQAIVRQHVKDYCIDDNLLRTIDEVAGDADANTAELQERRISYVLSTAYGWAWPIREFHLVVDKGKPGRWISLCMNKIARISPTKFESIISNFVPDRDLKILLVSRGE